MTKQNEAERDIRSAAQALAEAIARGQSLGLAVAWPTRPEGLAAIAISETGKARVDVTVQAGSAVPAPVAAKAAEAAQKAVDRTVEKGS